MKNVYGRSLAALCLLGLMVAVAAPAVAQMAENGKAPMYCYVGEWAIPRAQWADMEKANAADADVLVGRGSLAAAPVPFPVRAGLTCWTTTSTRR